MPPAERCPIKGTPGRPSPCSGCPPCTRPGLGCASGSPRVSMLPRKSLPMAGVAAHPRAHPCLPPALPLERHTDAPPRMTRALHGCSAPRLGSSRSPRSPRRACCLAKSVLVASVAAHRGLTHASRPTLPMKGTRMPSPMQRGPPRVLGPSSRLVEEPSKPSASMLPRKSVLVADVAAHPRGSPMPPPGSCPSKGTRMPLPPCNECPPRALGHVRLVESPRSPRRACCLGKETDASSPCLYRSYEGFTRCSVCLIGSRLPDESRFDA